MNQPNFQSILDRPHSEIEKPKPYPVGSYLFTIQGLPKYDKSSKKQTPYTEFTCKMMQALDDVDQEVLQAMGGIKDKTMRLTFYETEDAIWRLKQFLFEHLGLDENEFATLRAAAEQGAPGQQFIGVLVHEPSQDGQSVFAKIGQTAAVG